MNACSDQMRGLPGDGLEPGVAWAVSGMIGEASRLCPSPPPGLRRRGSAPARLRGGRPRRRPPGRRPPARLGLAPDTAWHARCLGAPPRLFSEKPSPRNPTPFRDRPAFCGVWGMSRRGFLSRLAVWAASLRNAAGGTRWKPGVPQSLEQERTLSLLSAPWNEGQDRLVPVITMGLGSWYQLVFQRKHRATTGRFLR
jgi:hypothetical protein